MIVNMSLFPFNYGDFWMSTKSYLGVYPQSNGNLQYIREPQIPGIFPTTNMSHLASLAQPRGTWAKPGTDENDDSDLDERPTGRAPGTGVGKRILLCKGTVCPQNCLDFYVCLHFLVASLFQEHSF